MPKLIKSIVGEIIQPINGDVIYISKISGQVQEEDYINLNGFIAYLQNLSKTEYTHALIKPLNFGLTNNYNIPITTLEISY